MTGDELLERAWEHKTSNDLHMPQRADFEGLLHESHVSWLEEAESYYL